MFSQRQRTIIILVDLLGFILSTGITLGEDLSPERKLHKRLFNDSYYSVDLLPLTNLSSTVNVWFGFDLVKIVNVNAKEQSLTVYGWVHQVSGSSMLKTSRTYNIIAVFSEKSILKEGTEAMFTFSLKWINPLLRWNESDFEGIRKLYVEPKRVWVPDIHLYNNNDGQEQFAGGRSSYRSGVTLYSNGTNTWFNPKMFTTLCRIKVKYFPFDIQECQLKFGSLVYDARTMNIEPLKTIIFPAEYFQENGEWDIYKVKMTRSEQYYQCCSDEPFVEITVTIEMGRESMDYFINLIVPCCLISSMIFLGFILPPESGERIGLSITVLLAMTVFQQLTSEIMPSYDFPILGQYYFAIIMEIGASVVVTTMILNFYHRTNRKMPGWVKKLVIDWIATIVFLTNTSEKRKIVRRKTMRRSRRRPRQRSRIQNDSHKRSIKKKQEDIKDQQNQGFNLVTFSDTIYCGPSVSEPVNTDMDNLGRQINFGVNSYPFQTSHETLEVPLKNNEEARPYMDDSDTLSEDELAIRHWEWTLVARILDRFFLVVAIVCGIVTVAAIFLRAPKLWTNLKKLTSDNREPLVDE